VQALWRQPSIGGTIGFAGVGDDFFVTVRILGEDVSLFLYDLTVAVDYPLACQVLDTLDIPVRRRRARSGASGLVTFPSSRIWAWTRWSSAPSRLTSTSTGRHRD